MKNERYDIFWYNIYAWRPIIIFKNMAKAYIIYRNLHIIVESSKCYCVIKLGKRTTINIGGCACAGINNSSNSKPLPMAAEVQ